MTRKWSVFFFFFQAEDGIRDFHVTGVQTCALPISTPMLCARFLKAHDPGSHGALYQMSERGWLWMNRTYKTTVGWVLRHQRFIFAVAILMVVVNVWLYITVPKGFFPQQDTGRMIGMVMGDQDVSFLDMLGKTNQFISIVKQDPAIQNVIASVGGGSAQNQARIFATLKPLAQRKISVDQVIARLRPKLSHVPGATLYFQGVQDLQIGGRMSNAQFQYTLSGENLSELYEWAPKLLQKLRTIPLLKDLNSDQQVSGLEANVIIDRDTASRLGITPSQIDNILYDAFGQRQISTIYRTLNQYHVVLEVDPKYQLTPDALQSVYVITSRGAQVPLSAFAQIGPSNTSLTVNHQGQFPAVTISFNLAPGGDLGTATRAISNAEMEMRIPATIHGSFQGTAAAFKDSLSSEPILILAALVAVYIVLGMLYESFIHPVTILSTLPSAGTGALLALLLFHMQLDVIGLIGIILLIGIVKKNAIIMIDFALEVERTGKTAEEAIHEAALIRFRPIMMTTAAAMLGAMPLAFGRGVGSEVRRPLGIAIVGGLIVSQALTLYTTPVVYLYMDRFKDFVVAHLPLRRKKVAKKEEEVPVFAD